MAQHLYGQNELASNASAQATSCTRVSESTIKINESQAHSPGAVITKKNFTIKHRYTIGSLGHLVSFAQNKS
jgi:hypothetical protein